MCLARVCIALMIQLSIMMHGDLIHYPTFPFRVQRFGTENDFAKLRITEYIQKLEFYPCSPIYITHLISYGALKKARSILDV